MNLKIIACFCATITVLLLGNCPSNAKTLAVTNLSDSGNGTLRGIVAGSVAAGDTINFAANFSGQTITLEPIRKIIFIPVVAEILRCGIITIGGECRDETEKDSPSQVASLRRVMGTDPPAASAPEAKSQSWQRTSASL
jgi:uncharacterized protein YjeT (DUF2065 family)